MKMIDNHERVSIDLTYLEAERLAAALDEILNGGSPTTLVLRLCEALEEYVNT